MVRGDQPLQYISEVGAGINVMDPAAGKQCVDDGTFVAGIRVANEHPVFFTNFGWTKL